MDSIRPSFLVLVTDLCSFAIAFMAHRSSVFPFDSEKRLGSFFLGVSPVGKLQKRKMSQPLIFFILFFYFFAPFSFLGTGLWYQPVRNWAWGVRLGGLLDGGGLKEQSGSLENSNRDGREAVLL